MTEVYDPFKGQPVTIEIGTVTRNMNPPRVITKRPPPPNSQVAPPFKPQEQQKKENEASSQG
jgi:hypothetical protein